MRHHLEVRKGTYHDSVTLMVVSQQVADLPKVHAAVVAMATELNLGLVAGLDLPPPDDAGPNDLLVALVAQDDEALDAARGAVERGLADASAGGPAATGDAERPPRTLGAAARRVAQSQPFDLALVSVPGEHAFVEAMDALRADLHVMVFSDQVPLAQERVLKAEAARRQRLVMGPDCGTAIVGGVGLGFANVTRAGPVGVVAASGTGAQHLTCLLDDAGIGVSAVLGVGGRDLSAEVGAASTLAAMAALDEDPATEVIVVLSKPPDAEVADRVRQAASACATPVQLGLVGRGERDLTAVAEATVSALGGAWRDARAWPADQPRGDRLVGLYSGGTLCDEAMAVAAARLGPIRSNVPLEPSWALTSEQLHTSGLAEHWMIDFGDDELTRGRVHPMIDHAVRRDRLLAEAAAQVATVALLDVVLGHGAHADPAAELAPAVHRARAEGAAVVIALIGTQADPQDRDRQAAAFADAGASVHLSNAAAARAACGLIRSHQA